MSRSESVSPAAQPANLSLESEAACSGDPRLTILNWNIRHGGGKRRGRILAAIAEAAPDVAVLTEYRTAPELLELLAGLGYGHQIMSNPPPRTNGVAIVSRDPLTERACCTTLPDWPVGRWVEVEHASGLHLLGIYLPSGSTDGGPTVKAAFWKALHEAAVALTDRPALIIGDLNTGAHYIDEERATFYSAQAFVALEEDLGWRDAYRLFHGDRRDYTWWSRRKGGGLANGFRLDHVFVSPGLAQAVIDCSYISEVRENGLSDHSAQVVCIGVPNPQHSDQLNAAAGWFGRSRRVGKSSIDCYNPPESAD